MLEALGLRLPVSFETPPLSTQRTLLPYDILIPRQQSEQDQRCHHKGTRERNPSPGVDQDGIFEEARPVT